MCKVLKDQNPEVSHMVLRQIHVNREIQHMVTDARGYHEKDTVHWDKILRMQKKGISH